MVCRIVRTRAVVLGGITSGLVNFVNAIFDKRFQFLGGRESVNDYLAVGPIHDTCHVELIV